MIRRSITLITSLLFVLPVAAVAQGDAAQDEASIRRLPIDDWCQAEEARDLDAKMKLFTTDAVLMPAGESSVIGQQAIRALHEKWWEGTEYKCSGAIDEVQVFGDWGLVRGTFSGVLSMESGEMHKYNGRFLNTVRRQEDGSWKIAHAIWNSD